MTTPQGPPPLSAIPVTSYAPSHAPTHVSSSSSSSSSSKPMNVNKKDSPSSPSPSPAMPLNPNHAGPATFEHFGFGAPAASASNPSPTDFLTPYPMNSSTMSSMSNAMSSMSNANTFSLSPDKLMQSYSHSSSSPPGTIEPFDPMAFCSMTSVC